MLKISTKKRKPIFKNCVICGNEFQKVNNSITCSAECGEINKEEYSRKTAREKYRKKVGLKTKIKCVVCGNEFDRVGSEKICSDPCREKRKEYYKENNKIEVTKKCGMCGDVIQSNQRICLDCKKKKKAEYQEEYYKNITKEKRRMKKALTDQCVEPQ